MQHVVLVQEFPEYVMIEKHCTFDLWMSDGCDERLEDFGGYDVNIYFDYDYSTGNSLKVEIVIS